MSKEGDTFDVPTHIARLSNLVVTSLGDGDDDVEGVEDGVEIPLPNVPTQVLAKVIEYCTHFREEPSECFVTHYYMLLLGLMMMLFLSYVYIA